MDAEIEHRAAAPGRIEKPVGPGRKLRQPRRRRRDRLAELAALHELDQRDIFAPEAQDMRHHQRSAGSLRRRDHAVAVGGGQRERLFEEHVLAGLERSDGRFGVEVRGQRVADRLDRWILDDRAVVGGRARADFTGELLRLVEMPGRDRRDADAGDLRIGAGMGGPHEARAENADFHAQGHLYDRPSEASLS